MLPEESSKMLSVFVMLSAGSSNVMSGLIIFC